MKNITSSVKQLQSAINALKSKTITITVRYNLQGKPSGIQHGGSFLTHAQKKFSGIVDTPTTMNGVRMGEGSKPELVTVTPLTRGTGNTSEPTVSSGKGFGGGRPIVLKNNIILDGRIIDKRIRKVALDEYSLQVLKIFYTAAVYIYCIISLVQQYHKQHMP